MENIKKPKLWNKTYAIAEQIASFIFLIIGLIKMPEDFNNQKIIVLIMAIYIITFIFSLLINVIIYSINMYFYCKKLENKIIELKESKRTIAKENREKSNIIFNLNKLVNEISNITKDVITHLETGMLNKNKNETKYLEKLYNIMKEKFKDIEKERNK